jgi:hypothetical protein
MFQLVDLLLDSLSSPSATLYLLLMDLHLPSYHKQMKDVRSAQVNGQEMGASSWLSLVLRFPSSAS